MYIPGIVGPPGQIWALGFDYSLANSVALIEGNIGYSYANTSLAKADVGNESLNALR
jgi:hypothetical protein